MFSMEKAQSLHNKSLRVKTSDNNIHVVAFFNLATFIGKGHPVNLAGFRRAALSQLADLFERRNHQFYASLRIDQTRLEFFVIKNLGLLGIQHAIAESDDFAGFRPFDAKRVEAPDELVISPRAACEAVGLIVYGGPERLCGASPRL